MRILFVSDAASIHTQRWLEFFRDRGDDVHVASFRPANIPGITVHSLPGSRFGRIGYLLAIPYLRCLRERLKPNINHAQYVTSYGFLSAAAGLRPLILTAWGTDVLLSPRYSWVMRWIVGYAVRSADRVTTVAEHMNQAVAKFGIPISEIVAIPFGVNIQRFRLPQNPRSQSGKFRLISTRNFSSVYSIHTIVEAVKFLESDGMEFHLDLVGDGSLRSELEHQVYAANLSDFVTFHGHVDHIQLEKLLGQAHVFISSSISDGNNVSLNEAMACGCFPIATRIQANTQWVEHGTNGLLFDCGDAIGLAQNIKIACSEVVFRNSVVATNRKIVEDRADWNGCTKKMLNLYEMLLKK